jgi:hypothetical protein
MNDNRSQYDNHSNWQWMYRLGAGAAFLSAVLIPVSIIVYLIWPFPSSPVIEIFNLIQQNRLAGWMSLDFLYMLGNLIAIPLVFCLYLTLRSTSQSFASLALILNMIGLVLIFPARPIAEMMALSDLHAQASSEAQHAMFLAAGEATLASFHGTVFDMHYILGSLALLIDSLIMLHSQIYSRATAWIGITANTLVFGLYVPVIGVTLSILSVFILLVWNILVGRRFFQLATSPPAGQRA